MAIEKAVLNNLRRFATAFREARERGANESDTVMYLIKFCEDVLGYDSLKGEISKELAIKDRYCDVALKVDGAVRVIVEAKAAGSALHDKHIEQAENYASRAGINWVVLTNTIDWRLYHLTFAEGEGITHELAFEVDLLKQLDADPEAAWSRLSLLTRESVHDDGLGEFWSRKKALSPASIVRALFTQDVLLVLRRELNRDAPARLDLDDVFAAIRDVLSKDALIAAGDLGIRKSRKRRKYARRAADATPGAPSVGPEESGDDAGEDDGDDEPEADGGVTNEGGTS